MTSSDLFDESVRATDAAMAQRIAEKRRFLEYQLQHTKRRGDSMSRSLAKLRKKYREIQFALRTLDSLEPADEGLGPCQGCDKPAVHFDNLETCVPLCQECYDAHIEDNRSREGSA